MDTDILNVVFTVLFIGITYIVNNRRAKYKMGWRQWGGVILTIVGLSSLFVLGGVFNESVLSETNIARFIYLIGGLCLWLIKPNKLKKNKLARS